MILLRIRSLTKRYAAVAALDGFDLDVRAGGRTAVVGPSGSGKSTLLRMIAGFDRPDAGTIVLDGKPLVDGTRGVPAHRRGIGIVAQDGALFPHLSVADNIGFGLARRAAGREATIRDLMRLVDLPLTLLDRRPHALSGGQQQRVALARALARKPRLMLLDEPFSALDPDLRESTRQATIEVLRSADIATILVTHDQGEALSFADQVAVLREGRLAEAGSPQDLYLRPRLRETALFLGD
ncbi:MAG: ABC transporter ATP-binding protein, partial [Microvirga sp.]